MQDFILAVEAVGAKHGGGAVVLGDVLRAAIRCEDIERITVFCSPRNVRSFDMPLSQKLFEVPQPYAEKSVLGRIHWLNRGLKGSVMALKADLVVCMNGIGKPPRTSPHDRFHFNRRVRFVTKHWCAVICEPRSA